MRLFTIPYAVALLVSTVQADILDEIAAADAKADAAVSAIRTPEELTAKQADWRKAWIAGLGGLPERTPLNVQEGPVVTCDGFTLQNVVFESQPGVYVVGRDAGRIILAAAASDTPVPLKATGWDCIAAAHAYAAEPQLFSCVEFDNPPPSWTEMVTNPDPKEDSFAIAVWGALEEYDWTDLVKGAVR